MSEFQAVADTIEFCGEVASLTEIISDLLLGVLSDSQAEGLGHAKCLVFHHQQPILWASSTGYARQVHFQELAVLPTGAATFEIRLAIIAVGIDQDKLEKSYTARLHSLRQKFSLSLRRKGG